LLLSRLGRATLAARSGTPYHGKTARDHFASPSRDIAAPGLLDPRLTRPKNKIASAILRLVAPLAWRRHPPSRRPTPTLDEELENAVVRPSARWRDFARNGFPSAARSTSAPQRARISENTAESLRGYVARLPPEALLRATLVGTSLGTSAALGVPAGDYFRGSGLGWIERGRRVSPVHAPRNHCGGDCAGAWRLIVRAGLARPERGKKRAEAQPNSPTVVAAAGQRRATPGGRVVAGPAGAVPPMFLEVIRLDAHPLGVRSSGLPGPGRTRRVTRRTISRCCTDVRGAPVDRNPVPVEATRLSCDAWLVAPR